MTEPARPTAALPTSPPDVSDFLHPVWTSPTWWAGVITAVVSLITGLIATFGHPIAAIPDSVVAVGALLAATLATGVINHQRSNVVSSAMAAAATVQAAHVQAHATVQAAMVSPTVVTPVLTATAPSAAETPSGGTTAPPTPSNRSTARSRPRKDADRA